MSRALDYLVRLSVTVGRRALFFEKGFGPVPLIESLFKLKESSYNRHENFQRLLPETPQITVDKVFYSQNGKVTCVDGHFVSPLVQVIPGALPPESEISRFRFVLPCSLSSYRGPLCVHLAGTGDHYFSRRQTLIAEPLLKNSSIASLILENPFYGSRKPPAQKGAHIFHVSDLMVMGAALTLETNFLLKWCAQHGLGPLGVTGISLGGHMASLAGCMCDQPIALVPCLSTVTSADVFTSGVLRTAVDWKALTRDISEMKRISYFDPSLVGSTAESMLYHLLELTTNLGTFPRPKGYAVSIIAKRDAYVPPDRHHEIHKIWPGVEVRMVEGGHVTSFISKRGHFLRGIADAFEHVKVPLPHLDAPSSPSPSTHRSLKEQDKDNGHHHHNSASNQHQGKISPLPSTDSLKHHAQQNIHNTRHSPSHH